MNCHYSTNLKVHSNTVIALNTRYKFLKHYEILLLTLKCNQPPSMLEFFILQSLLLLDQAKTFFSALRFLVFPSTSVSKK